MSDPSFSAAIVAGGQARRLGGIDKSGLIVGTRSILDRQVALLRTLTKDIFIVANDTARFAPTGLPVFPDRVTGAGALGGLYTALLEASTEQVLVLACDMPFLTAPLLRRLVTLGATADAAVPRDARGRHPLCGCYARRVAPHLQSRIASGQLRVTEALDELDVREIGPDEIQECDPTGHLLLNINTPDDVARARSWAAARTAR